MTSLQRNDWPTPLLQPDPHDGCILYSVTYLCHCFGHTEVTPKQVQTFREQTRKLEAMFPQWHCGLHMKRHWDHYDTDQAEWQRYWLGPTAQSWVETHLNQGYIGLVIVERVVGRAHAIVVLESHGDEGIFVMDPLYGHRVETWEWLLSAGPGQHGCHHIDGWYSREGEVAP
jgi:hypothetical protein